MTPPRPGGSHARSMRAHFRRDFVRSRACYDHHSELRAEFRGRSLERYSRASAAPEFARSVGGDGATCRGRMSRQERRQRRHQSLHRPRRGASRPTSGIKDCRKHLRPRLSAHTAWRFRSMAVATTHGLCRCQPRRQDSRQRSCSVTRYQRRPFLPRIQAHLRHVRTRLDPAPADRARTRSHAHHGRVAD